VAYYKLRNILQGEQFYGTAQKYEMKNQLKNINSLHFTAGLFCRG
jgi:hypothetical protein